jgi:hypothetical protein
MLERLWCSGRPGLYLPSLVLQHKAPARRLTRAYYRRWHRGHGRFTALRREAAVEQSRTRFLDVPAHLYRKAITDAGHWLGSKFTGASEDAFDRECFLYFFRGFFEQRVSDLRRARRSSAGSG